MDPLGALGNPKNAGTSKRTQSGKESMIQCTTKTVREREQEERMQKEIEAEKEHCRQLRNEAEIEREKVKL